MSFPRYPKYKDSGVAWLGEVPEHWEVKPIKAVATCNDEVLEESTFSDYEIEYIEISGVDMGRGICSTEIIPFGNAPSRARRRVADGDILVSTVRTYLRAIAPIIKPPGNLIASTGFAVIRPRYVVPHFLGYIFQAEFLVAEVIARSVGVSYPAINASDLMRLYVPLPLKVEQQAITAFLDRETEKIDALIAEQKRLVALLAEKRQAVISHAVTKGLNPDVPMKHSGIEWLGEVPEHWKVIPVAYGYNVQLGKMLDSTKIIGKHLRPYLRVFDVQWGVINTDDLPQMDFDEYARSKFQLEIGDLLVNEGGSYPGRSAIWSGEIDECYYQKALHRMRPHCSDEHTSKFMYYVMYWAANQGVFIAGGNETTIEHLPAEKLRKYRFAFPPIEEQLEIVSFLDTETAKFDTLTLEANRAIELLQERRSALISAAVTGKIDVRGIPGKSEAA